MSEKISKQAKSELLEVLRQRYQGAVRQDKTKILDEFSAIAGCHRKHAIRLLTGTPPALNKTIKPARRLYEEAVREALIVLWEAADRICGKRLKAVLPRLVDALEQHGHLHLDAAVRQRVLAVSAATIDRLLASVRGHTSHRKKRRTATKSSREVPYASPTTTLSPPPRPAEPTRRIPLTRLWQVLPEGDRYRALLTLSRIVAQQLPRPPAGREADHERT